MKSLTLEGTERNQFGGKEAARFRREGFVPCVIYGGSETVHFVAPYNAFKTIVYNPEFFTINITVNGKQYNTLLKEIQFHPVTDKISHIDFLELAPDKPVTAEVPVQLIGQSVGVREGGGKLDHKMRKLKVRALPKDLVEHIEVNIESLELGKTIKVGDLNLPNIELADQPYLPIVAVYVPRAVVVEEKAAMVTTEAAAAPAAGAEGDKKGDAAKADKKPEAKK